MKGLKESVLMELQNAPVYEFGIKHLDMLYNPEADQCFCLVEAPKREVLWQVRYQINRQRILEVKTTN